MGPWLCSVGAGDGGSGLWQVMWGWGWLRVCLGGKSEEEGLVISGKGISNAV